MKVKRMVTAGLLGAALMFGQPAAGRRARGFQSDALKQALNLSDAQVEQIREVSRQQMEGVRPLAEQMHEKASALREEMKKDSPDQAKVGQLSVDLKNLREQMKSKRAARGDSISTILTQEQREKLKTLEEAAKLGPAVRQATALGLISPEISPDRQQAMERGMRMRMQRRPAPGRLY